MLSFIKFLFLGLFIGHGTVIIYMLIKKQHLRPRAFIILGLYGLISFMGFYFTSHSVLQDKKEKLETELVQLKNKRAVIDDKLYREYVDVDMDAYIYLSEYYRTELDSQIYYTNQQIDKINEKLN